MKAVRTILGLFGVAAISLAACDTALRYDVEPAALADGRPSYESFIASHSFPYVAPADRQDTLRQNYAMLSLGLSKDEVSKVLGEPDASTLSYTKDTVPFRYLGSSWMYFLEKPDPRIVNLKRDISIHVFFDKEGKTHWIATNVDGLTEIGGPDHRLDSQSTIPVN